MKQKKILILGEDEKLRNAEDALGIMGGHNVTWISDGMRFEAALTVENLQKYDGLVIDIAPFISVTRLESLESSTIRFREGKKVWHEYGLHFVVYVRQTLGMRAKEIPIVLLSHLSQSLISPIEEEYHFFRKGEMSGKDLLKMVAE